MSVFGKKCANICSLIKKNRFFQKSAFFESPITQKRFIFAHNYVSYGKRQKSCTLIVILIILTYLTSAICNSSSKSTGFFQTRKYFTHENIFFCWQGINQKKKKGNSFFGIILPLSKGKHCTYNK